MFFERDGVLVMCNIIKYALLLLMAGWASIMCRAAGTTTNNMIGAEEKPSISASSARFCTLYEALSLVCDKLDARFVIRDNTVVICPVANRLTGGNTPGESGVDKGRRTRHDGRVECPIVRGSGGD